MPAPIRIIGDHYTQAGITATELYTVPDGCVLEIKSIIFRGTTANQYRLIWNAVKGGETLELFRAEYNDNVPSDYDTFTIFLMEKETLQLMINNVGADETLYINVCGWLWFNEELAYGVVSN